MTLAQNPKFNFVFLGQSILRYEVPLDIFSVESYHAKSDDFKNMSYDY